MEMVGLLVVAVDAGGAESPHVAGGLHVGGEIVKASMEIRDPFAHNPMPQLIRQADCFSSRQMEPLDLLQCDRKAVDLCVPAGGAGIADPLSIEVAAEVRAVVQVTGELLYLQM